ncbi:hypothetical protein VP01_328g3 [Puccinia sorghi]|uniref:Uncharacterized protein n=1 Tax=Puccinia sorghi TaxID=27349 RepID=A0A0L6UXK0_9BASI|nr:hypothetical protein VP01_328g3 [Puccinia sorghi]
MYTKRTGQCLSQTPTSWHKLQYNQSLSNFLDCRTLQICGIINSKLANYSSSLVSPILTNDTSKTDPVLLINSLHNIAYNENTNHDKGALSLTNGTQQNPLPSCKNRKHNPGLFHPAEKCWAFQPEQWPVRKGKSELNNHSAASLPITSPPLLNMRSQPLQVTPCLPTPSPHSLPYLPCFFGISHSSVSTFLISCDSLVFPFSPFVFSFHSILSGSQSKSQLFTQTTHHSPPILNTLKSHSQHQLSCFSHLLLYLIHS